MSDTGNECNVSFGKQLCVEVTNPSERSFQTEDSMENTITISQFMPKVKEVSKQHSIEEITVKILQQKGKVVQTFIEIGFLLIEAKEQ